jgi:hypothetical protein
MASDYILFVHGVNTRNTRERTTYADELINLISNQFYNESNHVKYVPLFWGDINVQEENKLLKTLQKSPLWERMWFQTFREKQLLQFAGDAALYISRFIGAKVVNKLKIDAYSELKDYQPDDRLHLVTHSWGTVILFDILFAARWDGQDVPGHNDVMEIRDLIFGISGADKNPLKGIKLASLHTMGSPIAIFSLLNVVPGKDEPQTTSSSKHDITPRLQELLRHLHENRQELKLPWRNFIHPGDPIAYPLKELITNLVDGQSKYLDVQDLITHEAGLFDYLTEPFSQTALALLHGGDAHGSYWTSNKVAEEITKCL